MQKDEFTARLLASCAFLLRYANSLTQTPTIAADLIQEKMLKALCHKDSFLRDENFNGWLASIMRNTYLNLLDRENRYIGADGCEYYDPQSYKDTVVEYNDLNGLVESLPKKLSVPFKMHANGYKYTEIASELCIPLSIVKNRIHIVKKAWNNFRWCRY